jgi:hypothetical protein
MSIGGGARRITARALARQRVVAASGGFQLDHQGSRPSPSHLVRRNPLDATGRRGVVRLRYPHHGLPCPGVSSCSMIGTPDETVAPLASALVRAGRAGSGQGITLPNGTAPGSGPLMDRRAFIGGAGLRSPDRLPDMAVGLLRTAARLTGEAGDGTTARALRWPRCAQGDGRGPERTGRHSLSTLPQSLRPRADEVIE